MLHTYTRRNTAGIDGLLDLTIKNTDGTVKVVQNVTVVHFKNDGTITTQSKRSGSYWRTSADVHRGGAVIVEAATAASLVYGSASPKNLSRAHALAVVVLMDNDEWLGNPV
jgi:hypothetical protein